MYSWFLIIVVGPAIYREEMAASSSRLSQTVPVPRKAPSLLEDLFLMFWQPCWSNKSTAYFGCMPYVQCVSNSSRSPWKWSQENIHRGTTPSGSCWSGCTRKWYTGTWLFRYQQSTNLLSIGQSTGISLKNHPATCFHPQKFTSCQQQEFIVMAVAGSILHRSENSSTVHAKTTRTNDPVLTFPGIAPQALH